MWDKLYNLFKRETATTNFIPAIDGLRFLAIWVVVVDHLHGFLRAKVATAYTTAATDYWFIYQFFDSNGQKGVFLFFLISAFILGMPFAKHFWQGEKKVVLKYYFLRRLTRLEPPYIFNMVACYFLLILYTGHEFSAMFPKTFAGLFPNLASSLVYLHNIIYSHAFSVNPVSWSLEIEVQFYILVPLLVLSFKLPKLSRRIVWLTIIFLLTLAQQFYLPKILTIYHFLQYFLLGFLALDLYLSGFKLNFSKWGSIIGGTGLLLIFFYLDRYRTPYFDFWFLPLVFFVFMMAMTNDFWRKVFSLKFITAVGGMCYTIYLWHNLIISGVANKTIQFNLGFSNSYVLTLLWQMSVVLIFVLAGSAFFYLLIEKPCMDRHWPIKLWRFITGRKSDEMVEQIKPNR